MGDLLRGIPAIQRGGRGGFLLLGGGSSVWSDGG
jgi:hypothetical protein